MGSIQAFPRKPAAAVQPARAWRTGPAAGATIRVRESRIEDFAAVRALQQAAHPELPALSLRQFESRRTAFAEGQLVAVCEGEIAGYACSLVVRWDDFGLEHTWKQVTGDGHFTTHQPAGGTLYAAGLGVDDMQGGFAAARALLQAERRLCRRRNLCRMLAPVRLAGYGASRHGAAPERYAMKVIWGDLEERWLRFHLSQGMNYCGVIRDFLPEDAAAAGHAALLAWLNPLHSPPGPPARIQPMGSRKCA